MNNPINKDSLALQNLRDTLVDDLLAMSDDEILADSGEIGMDVEHEAMQVRQVLDHAAGKVRMAVAKAEMSTYHTRGVSHIRSAASLPANDLQEARLTLAARNGKDQTEADLKSVAEDLAKLATFKDNSER